jgi:4-amino-4-deoxy-L-arabinose transferase-like glycosyltransferase
VFPPADDGHYYDVLAQRLARGQGYTWLWPDGAVTFAAHYPVGYPALLALAYRLAGASPAVAMGVNAVIGTAAAVAVYGLVASTEGPRWRPLAAGMAVALHPALVPYTAALMTEGVTAALLAMATALAARAQASAAPSAAGFRGWPWLVATGVALGVTTLVRPQSILFAPVLGLLAAPASVGWGRVRLMRAAAVLALALGIVAPWTARNCVRMHRCALVSVNGGWNLLIGTQTRSGGWEPVQVPAECATVWDEAGKDACFERAARARIAASPAAWLARAPGKLASTLDYFGAGPYYLHVSNEAAFTERAKVRLGVLETVVSRLLLLSALVVALAWPGPRRLARAGVAALGAIAAVTVHGWLGYVALVLVVGLLGPRAWARAPLVVPAGAALVLLTAAMHALFFGAGRYGLVVVPLVTAMAFVSAPRAQSAKDPSPRS